MTTTVERARSRRVPGTRRATTCKKAGRGGDGVEPVDVGHRGELDVVEPTPRSLPVDQFPLVKPVEGLRHCALRSCRHGCRPRRQWRWRRARYSRRRRDLRLCGSENHSGAEPRRGVRRRRTGRVQRCVLGVKVCPVAVERATNIRVAGDEQTASRGSSGSVGESGQSPEAMSLLVWTMIDVSLVVS